MELVIGQPKIVVVGEGMVELSTQGREASIAYGGDTLNTAIHLARFGIPTAYLTALGGDPFSKKLREEWSSEGLDTSLIVTDPDRHPGLYAIHTDRNGERSFTYWRNQSAARRMFELGESAQAIERAQHASLLYFSLISLAILPPAGRERLLTLAEVVRRKGGRIAFDTNYRPALWRSIREARRMRDAAIAVCDVGLPSMEDERLLSGHRSARMVAADWQSRGASETVVKMGSDGVFMAGALMPPPHALHPIDTTGAGDAFNAGYLVSRLRGADPVDAVRSGQAVGGWVVMRRGAIPPLDEDAPYFMASD